MKVDLNNIQIIVPDAVLGIFEHHKQREQLSLESGGVVFGQVSQDERTVLVSRVSVPGPYDNATRSSFHRDQAWAQGLTEYEYINSNGYVVYLGEWHTHPAKRAHSSMQDQNMIAEQYRQNDIETSFLLLFIIALDEMMLGFYNGYKLISEIVRFENHKLR